jgi:hypothetical protein
MRIIATSIFVSVCELSFSQIDNFPNDFSDKAFIHVEKLCSFGFRKADSNAKTETANYISQCFQSLGLVTSVEPFEFKYFESKKIQLECSREKFDGINFYFNPYSQSIIEGFPLLINNDSSINKMNMKNISSSIMIITQEINIYQLIGKNPKALVVVSDSVYNVLAKSSKNLKIKVRYDGSLEVMKSVNIIGTINPLLENEIIISAHWDSFDGPGASDNASGVGVMIELARYFSSTKPNCKIRFIAFGAEELGSLGAKAYVQKHKNELKNCKMVFNIDEVGGYDNIYIEMLGGVHHVPEKNEYGFDLKTASLALTDYHYDWFLNSIDSETSNVPAWLSDAISESCNDLQIKFVSSNGMGSDHQIFFSCGIVATNICYSGGNKTHCPEDLPQQVNKSGLEKTGKIVALTIKKVINTR